MAKGNAEWDYPLDKFYGTQAFAVRRDDALDASAYIDDNKWRLNDTGGAYDLLLAHWARERWWPRIGHFLASCPAFVQHVGMVSVINPRDNVHTFESWPGRDWSYLNQAAAAEVLP